MSAAAVPVVGLMLLTQGRAECAHGIRFQVAKGRRLSALESMALQAIRRAA